jgi:hypothetical protein
VEDVPLPGSGVAGGLSATYNSTGTENVFWRAAGGQLTHDYFTGSGVWIPGLVAAAGDLVSDPVALATGADGLGVFYRTDTEMPSHFYFPSPQDSWVAQSLPGSGVSGLVVPVLTRESGEDAFFFTTSGELYHDYFSGSGSWIGPSFLPS